MDSKEEMDSNEGINKGETIIEQVIVLVLKRSV